MGLPGIQGHDKERMATTNAAAESVLGKSRCINPGAALLGEKIQGTVCTDAHLQKGARPSKVYGGMNTTMLNSLQGAGKKKQCGRHDVEEIRLWPDMCCRHRHHLQGWTPQVNGDSRTWYPSKEKAEYIARLVFHIVRFASTWREPRQLKRSPPSAVRPGAGGNPVKLELTKEGVAGARSDNARKEAVGSWQT